MNFNHNLNAAVPNPLAREYYWVILLKISVRVSAASPQNYSLHKIGFAGG